jgi:hypothetical protein
MTATPDVIEAVAPHRVQLSRRKGWRMPPNTVSVARPGKWGNEFRIGETAEYYTGHEHPLTREDAVYQFRLHAEAHHAICADYYAELRGKNLACWCPLDQTCHADVLLELANAARKEAKEALGA